MLRFAPSPTGFLHMGNIRIALLNFLYAKKNNINFFLRIDDTDTERSKKEYVDSIIDDLDWLGINYNEIIKQSERMKKYREIFNLLKSKNQIYPCFESSEELSLKRKIQLKQGKPPIYDRASLNLKKSDISELVRSGKKPHWRLKLDDDQIKWRDMIHGEITFNNLSVSDPVVFRSDEMPLFTITSVVDDADMKVTNIFRGDDHITNTAAQIKLFKIIDSSIPQFGHFPLMNLKSGKGLSKRSNSYSIKMCKSDKIFSIVIMNYLQKIGTSESMEHIEDIDTLISKFDLTKFSRSSVIFDKEDVNRLNSKYLKSLDSNEINNQFSLNIDKSFWAIIKSNVNSTDDIIDWFNLINNDFEIKESIILKKGLKKIILDSLPNEINEETWSNWTSKILNNYDLKPKDLYVNLRIILTGKKFGPSMNDLLTLFKKDKIIKRVVVNCEEED